MRPYEDENGKKIHSLSIVQSLSLLPSIAKVPAIIDMTDLYFPLGTFEVLSVPRDANNEESQ